MVKLKVTHRSAQAVKIELIEGESSVDLTPHTTEFNVDMRANEPIEVSLRLAFMPDDFIMESEGGVRIERIDIKRRLGDI